MVGVVGVVKILSFFLLFEAYKKILMMMMMIQKNLLMMMMMMILMMLTKIVTSEEFTCHNNTCKENKYFAEDGMCTDCPSGKKSESGAISTRYCYHVVFDFNDRTLFEYILCMCVCEM